MDLCVVRDERRLSLVPATDLDRDRFSRLPKHYPMELQVRFSRTSKLNRWYRGLVAHVAEAIDVHPDALHADLKTKAGLIESVLVSGVMRGAIVIRLKSTAFPAMEDLEFDEYCTFAVETLFKDYLPNVRAREKQALIGEWAGRRPALEAPPKLIAR